MLLALAGLLVPGVSRLPRPVGAILFTLPLVLIAWRRDSQALRWWAIYVCSFTLFALLRRHAHEVGFPVHTAYPIAADRLLALGTIPTVWLQEHLPRSGLLPWLAIAVHLSYYVAPPLAGLWLWLRTPRLPAYVQDLVWLYALALLTHVVLPTVPPWLAALQGDLPGVTRLLHDLLYPNAPGFYAFGERIAAGNHVAAMPSVHAAVPVVIARQLRHPLAWIYATAMAFSLVWLGEHYAVDIIAGVALAWMVGPLPRARVCGRQRPFRTKSSEYGELPLDNPLR